MDAEEITRAKWHTLVRTFRTSAGLLRDPAPELWAETERAEAIVSGLLAFDLPLVEFSPFAGLPDAALTVEGQRAPAPGRGASRPPLLPAREGLRPASGVGPSIPGAAAPSRESPAGTEPDTGAGTTAPPVFSLRRSSRPVTATHEPLDRASLSSPQASATSRARTALEPPSTALPGDSTLPELSSMPSAGKSTELAPSSPASREHSSAASRTGATPSQPSPIPDIAQRAAGSPTQVPARGPAPESSAEAGSRQPSSLLNDLADEILAASGSRTPTSTPPGAQVASSRPAPPIEPTALAPGAASTTAVAAPKARSSPLPAPGQQQPEEGSTAHSHPASVPVATIWPHPVEPGATGQPASVVHAHPALEAIDSLANELLGTSSTGPNGAGLRPAPGLARQAPAAPALETEEFEEFGYAPSGPQSALPEIAYVDENRELWSPASGKSEQGSSEPETSAATADRNAPGQWPKREPGPKLPPLDADTLALLVNEALVEQARRHGVDLS